MNYLHSEKKLNEVAVNKLIQTRLTKTAGMWANTGVENALKLLKHIDSLANHSKRDQEISLFNYLQIGMGTSNKLRSSVAAVFAAELGYDVKKISDAYSESVLTAVSSVENYFQFIERNYIAPALNGTAQNIEKEMVEFKSGNEPKM